MSTQVYFWRRTDVQGMERLELVRLHDAITATSTVLCVEDGGFRIEHHWRLSPDWQAQSVRVERWGAQGHSRLLLERDGEGDHSRWRVDGTARADLDGAEEPDLCITPFCNTFPIRRVPESAGQSLTLDTAYIDAAALTVRRSRQRYDRQGPGRFRYVDLGVSAGFEADLLVDGDGMVLRYQHLFERVAAA